MAAKNQAKADLLYNAIDSSDFYSAPVARADRSVMNVPFTLADDALMVSFARRKPGPVYPEGAPQRRRYASEYL